MKVYIISLIWIIISINSYAQRVSLNELLELQELSPVDVEDVLLAKGFENEPSKKLDKYDTYSFRKFDSSSTNYMGISKDTFKDKNVQTSFYTLKVADYNKIKNDLKVNSFNFMQTEKPDDNTHKHIYKKGNILVTMQVHYITDYKMNSYFIMVINLENEDYYWNNRDN